MPPRSNQVRGRQRLNAPPAAPTGQQEAATFTPPQPPVEQGGVASNMVSSLPPIASGADVYARQFYRGSRVPFRRYLPIVNQ